MRAALIAALCVPACGGAGSPSVADGGAVDAAGELDAAAPPCPPAIAALRHARADQALTGSILELWGGAAQYLRHETGSDQLAGYWIYAQALDAVLDGVERTGGARYLGLVDSLADGQAARGWSSDYYDDENWLALALLRGFDLTGDGAFLERAKLLYADIMAAWDETCCGAQPGGIWWNRAHTQKATASNGGPVITGVRLAERTGDASYLEFAVKVYAYWAAQMIDPVTHQVLDHIDPDGHAVDWKFTYNEGVMLGGALALHRATGEARYLDDARARAAFMVAEETVATPLGPVLSDGACGGDCQMFKGIGYRYLAELARFEPDPEIDAVLAASAEAVWTLARDPATGHFGPEWAGPPPTGSVTLAQQSAALMALSIDALRCGTDAGDPGARVEAEEGRLDRVGLEAGHPGFTGWGYLAGWNGDGQAVTLRLVAPIAGAYRLRFRYAAGAGAAARRVLLDGDELAAALGFPSTGSWDSYATVDLPVTLPAAATALTIRYDAAAGSTSYLNLDHVELVAGP